MRSRDVAAADRGGRRRDPDIDRRCLSAARLLYAEAGSGAVTFEAVSRRTGVGKPAIYRRWESADDLLTNALEQTDFDIEIHRTGDARSELIAFTSELMDYFASPNGPVVMRLIIELHEQSPLYRAVGNFAAEKTLHAVTEIVQQGIDGGQIDSNLTPTMVTGLLSGAALYEVLARRDGLSLSTPGDDYAERLVDMILQHKGRD
jgi:AcrR family transcriptional regulator